MSETQNNMEIWEQVADTNPGHTKSVEFGRKFTSIDAYSQIQRATEVFGAVGKGWGWDSELLFNADGLVICKTKIWYKLNDEKHTTGEIYGCCKSHFKDKIDDDAPKKALTDAITKGLSYLGFNADVFLGKFDDSKYVEKQVEKYQQNDKVETWKGWVADIKSKEKLIEIYTKNDGEMKRKLDSFAKRDNMKCIYDAFYNKAEEFECEEIMEG